MLTVFWYLWTYILEEIARSDFAWSKGNCIFTFVNFFLNSPPQQLHKFSPTRKVLEYEVHHSLSTEHVTQHLHFFHSNWWESVVLICISLKIMSMFFFICLNATCVSLWAVCLVRYLFLSEVFMFFFSTFKIYILRRLSLCGVIFSPNLFFALIFFFAITYKNCNVDFFFSVVLPLCTWSHCR